MNEREKRLDDLLNKMSANMKEMESLCMPEYHRFRDDNIEAKFNKYKETEKRLQKLSELCKEMNEMIEESNKILYRQTPILYNICNMNRRIKELEKEEDPLLVDAKDWRNRLLKELNE